MLQKLDTIVQNNNSLLCVGLDPVLEKLPQHIRGKKDPFFEFNKSIIDSTHDLVCAFKPNPAFYEALGAEGVKQLKLTCDYIIKTYPEVFLIIDAKRGDIGNTNEAYAKYVYDYLGGDAVTMHPYLGQEALKPFLDRKDRACIVFCRSSNPGGGEFQDLPIDGEPLYKVVAKKVTTEWNYNNNCMMIVGAPYPEELAEVRKIAGEMTFLVPGVGSQGGDIEAVVKAGLNSKKTGIIINASRSIIFASSGTDFAEKAREETKKLREAINNFR